jgi:hypothetical protein
MLATLLLSCMPIVANRELIFWDAAGRASDVVVALIRGSGFDYLPQILPARENPDIRTAPEEPQRLADRSLSSEESASQGMAESQEDGQISPLVPSPDLLEPRSSRDRLTIVPGARKQTIPRPRTTSSPSAPSLPAARVSRRNDSLDEDPQTLQNYTKFLIKAGLAPIAEQHLRQVMRDAPGTPAAVEARQTLDSISRN